MCGGGRAGCGGWDSVGGGGGWAAGSAAQEGGVWAGACTGECTACGARPMSRTAKPLEHWRKAGGTAAAPRTWASSAATRLASSSASLRAMPLNPSAPCCLQGWGSSITSSWVETTGTTGCDDGQLRAGGLRRARCMPSNALGLRPHAVGAGGGAAGSWQPGEAHLRLIAAVAAATCPPGCTAMRGGCSSTGQTLLLPLQHPAWGLLRPRAER